MKEGRHGENIKNSTEIITSICALNLQSTTIQFISYSLEPDNSLGILKESRSTIVTLSPTNAFTGARALPTHSVTAAVDGATGVTVAG